MYDVSGQYPLSNVILNRQMQLLPAKARKSMENASGLIRNLYKSFTALSIHVCLLIAINALQFLSPAYLCNLVPLPKSLPLLVSTDGFYIPVSLVFLWQMQEARSAEYLKAINTNNSLIIIPYLMLVFRQCEHY